MQIQSASMKELMLLIAGLRAIHISDSVKEKHKLLIQLETELSTRYGVMVGTDAEQERNISMSTIG